MITSHDVRIKCFTLLNVNKQIQARTAKRFRNFVRAVHGDILARNRRLYRAHAESRLLRSGYSCAPFLFQQCCEIHASAALHVKPYADFLQVRIGLMNSLKAQAEETILTELVFS